jgi:hypothetical protein
VLVPASLIVGTVVEVVGNSNISMSSKASSEIAFLSASMLDIPSVGSPNGAAVMAHREAKIADCFNSRFPFDTNY